MSSVTQTPGTTIRLRYRDTAGVDKDLPYPLDIIPHIIHTRTGPKPRLLSQDHFQSVHNSSWHNDAIGSAFRDTDVWFGGHPTLRLDTQKNSTPNTDPGSNTDTSGVICKRRFNKSSTSKLDLGQFQMEWWMRFTSANSRVSSQYSAAIYHRDATNIYGFWLWLDAPNNQLKINNAGSYTSVLSADFGGSGAAYEPDAVTGGTFDRAGHWSYLRLVVDFTTGKYVECQVDDKTVDLSTYSYATAASSGGQVLHFSHQYASRNTSPRFVNIADILISEL